MADQENFPDIYIDESVSPGGVGSLADPYSDFSEINWTAGGDNSITDYYGGSPSASVTINLKKGETWLEKLTVGESGTATYPIITQAYGSGNLPIIDGELTRTTCITITGQDYITIDALELKNSISTSGEVSCTTATGIIVRNCNIYNASNRGIVFSDCADCTAEDNLIDTTVVDNEIQNDSIYVQLGTGGHTISGNIIYMRKEGYYVDGIQIAQEGGPVTISRNWIEIVAGYASDQGNIGINIELVTGTYDVSYNVVINGSPNSGSVLILENAGSATINVYNNALVQLNDGNNTIDVINMTSGYTLKNNIIYASNDTCFRASGGIDAPHSRLDYNCYYRDTGTNIAQDEGGEKTWAQWQSAGYEPNGINADPKFVNLGTLDFHLQSSSPCIDKGVDVSLTPDYDGKTVPRGPKPDIGAFEWQGDVIREGIKVEIE